MRRGLAVLLAAVAASWPGSASAAPARVVSVNLCADQLVTLLAPERVVSVTHLAPERSMSFVADRIGGYTINHGNAEEVLALRPDLVVAGRFAARPAVAMVRRLGIAVIDLPLVESFAQVRDQVRLLGDALGVPERAETLLARMDARLERVRGAPGSERPLALVLGANGFTSGSGTLIDEVLRAAGLENAAATRLGVTGYGQVGLEDIVTVRPDVVVLNEDLTEGPSLARQFLDHPALAAFGLDVQVVRVPGRLWTCGGPYTAGAVERLAEAVR